jgi:hypothetical protein
MEPSRKRQEAEQKFPNLHEAVEAGDLSAVDDFLRQGADIGELDSRGAPPLQIAAARGHLEIAHLLVDHGADVNFLIMGGGTPLSGAARCLKPRIVEFLLSKGAQTDKRGGNGLFPLHCPFQPDVAAVRQQLECIRLLAANGADINARSDFGSTPLMKAAWFGNNDAAVELLRLGADPTLRDNRGRTAAMMAFERGHDELAHLLKCRAGASEGVDPG